MKSRLWWLSLTAVVASLPNSQESRQPPVRPSLALQILHPSPCSLMRFRRQLTP